MAEELNYSKRELDHYFDEIKEICRLQNIVLTRIEAQTMKTNGRVSKLEDWRTAIAWGFGFMFSGVLFVINYLK